MKPKMVLPFVLPFFMLCRQSGKTEAQNTIASNNLKESGNPWPNVKSIPLPEGYTRPAHDTTGFENWLENLKLKKDKTVYLFNGERKANQRAQYAVLDISVGDRDLQQCADAVMRLRAEYLFAQKRFTEIIFTDNNGKPYAYSGGGDRRRFNEYLNTVFINCGTLSLERQLAAITDVSKVKAGDVLIRGGSPGHAMLVIDVAVNQAAEKIFLLSQSYMPAQDIHIVINPAHPANPWYNLNDREIQTPEYFFSRGHFRTWR